MSKLPIVINRSTTLIQIVTKNCDYDYSLNYHLVFFDRNELKNRANFYNKACHAFMCK